MLELGTATWKGFPVVILMPYAYQHSSHPAFSRRPSWNKSESLFFQMSTQFSTQTNSSKPVTICGFVIVKNPSSSQVDQSIWWGLLADLRAERMQRKIHGAGGPSREKNTCTENQWETWKNQPCIIHASCVVLVRIKRKKKLPVVETHWFRN